MAELTAARDAAAAVDMVELRLDGVRDLDVAQALHGAHIPVIATCRPAWEGGRFEGSEEERRDVLARALALGAAYVDIEWRAGFDDLIRANGSRVVVSSHDFAGVPDDLDTRARAMRGTGAALIKVAVTAARLSDTLPLLDIAKDGDAVVIGMGDAGVPSRLLASRFGSRWTYAGNGVAPGQLPAARMIQQFRFRTVGARTALYGVVGDNVMHSVSPAMHNAACTAAELDAVYVPLRAADFPDFLAFADAMGIAGASVTIPLQARRAARVPGLRRPDAPRWRGQHDSASASWAGGVRMGGDQHGCGRFSRTAGCGVGVPTSSGRTGGFRPACRCSGQAVPRGLSSWRSRRGMPT